jgi:hypothetical protein
MSIVSTHLLNSSVTIITCQIIECNALSILPIAVLGDEQILIVISLQLFLVVIFVLS